MPNSADNSGVHADNTLAQVEPELFDNTDSSRETGYQEVKDSGRVKGYYHKSTFAHTESGDGAPTYQNQAPSIDNPGDQASSVSVDEYAGERWRTVSESPAYEVSDLGRVRSWRPMGRAAQGDPLARANKPRIIEGWAQRYGHRMVVLRAASGAQAHRYVHALVLEAFVSPCPEGMECTHLDGDPANNRLENLAWRTRMDNQKDRRFHETMGRRQVRYGEPVYLTAGELNRLRALASRLQHTEDGDGAALLDSILRRARGNRTAARP